MSTKQKIAKILAARDNLPVEDILDQLGEMLEEMRDAAECGDFELDLEGIWTEWTELEPDYFAEFVAENL